VRWNQSAPSHQERLKFSPLNGIQQGTYRKPTFLGRPLKRVCDSHDVPPIKLDCPHSLPYARVDMQLQHHVHTLSPGKWVRCSKVERKEGQLSCELALDRQYDLIDAYAKTPHIHFMNCRSVEDLRRFTLAWGPLWLVLEPGNEDLRLGRATRRIHECQAHHRWLRALKGLTEACRGRTDQRGALVEFLRAEVDLDETSNTYQPDKIPTFLLSLQYSFGYVGDSVAWAASTNIGRVQKALAFCVEAHVRAPVGCLRVETKGREGFEIHPSFPLSTLWEAMQWMLWVDEWNGWPPPVCPECHKIFPQSTGHKKKYCSPPCAHRATNRKWRRKDIRARKKLPKVAANGGTNGTHKAG